MKSNTQNSKIAAITETTLVVGVDIGSETHYARAFDWRGYEFSKKPLSFSNTEAGFESFRSWMEAIAQKNGKKTFFVGMEPTGHYWFNLGVFIQNCGMKLVHVNPSHVKKSKELDDCNPSKNDRKDPKVIAGLIKEGRFSYPYIPTGIYAEIRSLSNQRLQAQAEDTRVRNQIARWISIYFPEYKDVYGKVDAVSGMMVLRQAPLPEDIVALGAEGVNQIWRNAKLRSVGMKRAKTLVSAAEHSIGRKEAPDAARMEIRNLIESYEICQRRLNEIMEALTDQVSQVPYVDKLLAIKGVGIRTVAGFVAEVGDLGRFESPKQVQKLAGLAIVENSSGKHKGEAHISYRGRKRLRYLMFEAALSVAGKNEEFREIHRYYTTRKNNPLKKMQSLIAVACKLIRVFYAILTKGEDYDGARMLADIRRPEAAPQAA